MKIGIVQFSTTWEDIDSSIRSVDSLLSNIESEIDLLIFPELSLTGFTMQSKKFAEEFDGQATQYFKNLAEKLRTNIFCGVIEQDGESIYNSLIHFDEMGLLKARYRKIHSFSPARENEFYQSTRDLVVTDINHARIGLTICYDLRFPELYRLYSKEGIQILVDIANWPSPRIDHWTTLLKARAIENQCFMIGVNRVGTDTDHVYPGKSAIFDPLGKEILMCDDSEKIFYAELNLDEVANTREVLPFLKDMKLI